MDSIPDGIKSLFVFIRLKEPLVFMPFLCKAMMTMTHFRIIRDFILNWFKPLSWLVSCSFHNHEHKHIYAQEVYIIHYYRLINLLSLPQHCQFLSHKVNCFFGLSIFHSVQARTIPQWVAGQGPWNDTLLLYNINDAVVTVIYTRFVFMLRELHSRFVTVSLHM